MIKKPNLAWSVLVLDSSHSCLQGMLLHPKIPARGWGCGGTGFDSQLWEGHFAFLRSMLWVLLVKCVYYHISEGL